MNKAVKNARAKQSVLPSIKFNPNPQIEAETEVMSKPLVEIRQASTGESWVNLIRKQEEPTTKEVPTKGVTLTVTPPKGRRRKKNPKTPDTTAASHIEEEEEEEELEWAVEEEEEEGKVIDIKIVRKLLMEHERRVKKMLNEKLAVINKCIKVENLALTNYLNKLTQNVTDLNDILQKGIISIADRNMYDHSRNHSFSLGAKPPVIKEWRMMTCQKCECSLAIPVSATYNNCPNCGHENKE